MKQATLDLLDAELREKGSEFRKYPSEVRYKLFRKRFLLDPLNWEKYFSEVDQYTYDWKEFKFSEVQNLDKLIDSDAPGIYFFYVKPVSQIYSLPNFV